MAAYTTGRDDLANVIAQSVSGVAGTAPDARDYAMADRILARIDRYVSGEDRIRITGYIGDRRMAVAAIRFCNADISRRRAERILDDLPKTIPLDGDVSLEEVEAQLHSSMVDYVVV